MADLVILVMLFARLALRDLAFLDLFIDALVLVLQAAVHLVAARMVLLPLRLGLRRAGADEEDEGGDGGCGKKLVHGSIPLRSFLAGGHAACHRS